MASPRTLGKGDEGLTGLFVEAGSGDVRAAGHAAQPFLRKTSALPRVWHRPPDHQEVCCKFGSTK